MTTIRESVDPDILATVTEDELDAAAIVLVKIKSRLLELAGGEAEGGQDFET
ncbi:MAG: hypothetical protein V4521_04205 [Pseudomonadota bacterium]